MFRIPKPTAWVPAAATPDVPPPARMPRAAKAFLVAVYAASILEMAGVEIAAFTAPVIVALNLLAPAIVGRLAPEAAVAASHARWLFVGGKRASLLVAVVVAVGLSSFLGLSGQQLGILTVVAVAALVLLWLVLATRSFRGLVMLLRDRPVGGTEAAP